MPKYLWQPSKPIKEAKPNLAFDTETSDGYIRLIADSTGRKLALKGLDEYLQFLTYKPYRNTVNWFYNLTYDTNSLLKFLNRQQRKEIVANNQIDVGKYRISMIPNKELKISIIKKGEYNKDGTLKIQNSVFFFDLAQFYDFKRLKTLAKQVNMEKIEVEDIANIDWYKYTLDVDYNNLINSRCIVDCEITKALADKLTIEINKLVIINKYKSKASIARKYVLENLKKKLSLPDYGLLQASLDCYHAGHIETLRMGKFRNIHNYDINSAYPHAMSNIYETDGAYVRNRQYEPDSIYSYYKIDVDYDNRYISPLWVSRASNNYHATGMFQTWVTKTEYEYLEVQGYDIIIENAYHLMRTSDSIKPFENIIDDLYQRRLQAKEEKDDIQKVIKVILNSMYGVTINTVLKYETTEEDTDMWIVNAYNEIINYKKTFKATNMYNPLFAAEITAQTRMKIFNDFGGHVKNVNSINTDGVYLTKKLNHLKLDNKLGNYSYEKIDNQILLGSGRYFYQNEDGSIDSDKSRFRSVSMAPDEMFGMMDINRDQKNITVDKTKVIKLKESLKNSNYYNLSFSSFPIQHYAEKDLFNTFQTVPKQINFYESRRKWYDQFDNIQEIFDKQLESRPYNVNELT
jgi:hypothetical protein